MSRWMILSFATMIVGVTWVQANAGPNVGGTLVLHRNLALAYTADHDYCGESGLTSCEEAVVTAPANPDSIVIFHVLAAFPSGSGPRLKGLAFGIDYDPDRLVLVAHGPCIGDPNNGGAEFPGAGWPENHTGTALVFQLTRTTQLVECYWFSAHSYAEGDTTPFQLTAHPDSALGGTFADDELPSALDPITDYGRLGFGVPGYLPCPTAGDEGPSGPDEPEGGGGTPLLPTTPPVLLPSTDTSPFHKVDLYADTAGTSGYVQHHWSSWSYPSFLKNSSLLVMRDYQDTIAVCNSYANDHVVLEWRNSNPAQVKFTVNPPRRATSLYLLSMIDVATPSDSGAPIAVVTLTDTTAQVLSDTLSIGSELRCTWKHDCEADLYTRHATNPLCGEVWRGPHAYGDSAFYDVQELALPKDWWAHGISEVALSQQAQHEYCCRQDCAGGVLQTRLILSGVSLGTNYHIIAANADSVVSQRQDDTAWSSHPYGGLLYNGEVIGTWRTIGELGCFLTCVSMASSYYGAPCNPDTLNLGFPRKDGHSVSIRSRLEGDRADVVEV